MHGTPTIIPFPIISGQKPLSPTVKGDQSVADAGFEFLLAQIVQGNGATAGMASGAQVLPSGTAKGSSQPDAQSVPRSAAPEPDLLSFLLTNVVTSENLAKMSPAVVEDEVAVFPFAIGHTDGEKVDRTFVSLQRPPLSTDQLLLAVTPEPDNGPLVIFPAQVPAQNANDVTTPTCVVPARLTLSETDLTRLEAFLANTVSVIAADNGNQFHQTSDLTVLSRELNKNELCGTTNLEKVLRDQFPSLKIDGVSADIKLDLISQSADAMPTKVTPPLAKIADDKLLDNLTRFGLSEPKVVMGQTKTVAQAEPQPRSEMTTLLSSKSPVVVDQVGVDSRSPAKAPEMMLSPMSEDAAPCLQVKTASQGKPAEAANEVIAVRSTQKTGTQSSESSSDLSQSLGEWSNPADDRQGTVKTEVVLQRQSEPADKGKFKIEFSRFQIDALLKRGEIRIQLHPSYLGNMRIKLVSTPQEFSARIEMSTESARNVVEQNLPQLKENLERAGIKVDHLEVVLDDQRSRQQQQSQCQSQRRYKPATEPRQEVAGDHKIIGTAGVSAAGILSLGSLNLLA